jgi:hypothetical protein
MIDTSKSNDGVILIEKDKIYILNNGDEIQSNRWKL